jgi:hypothetical protein
MGRMREHGWIMISEDVYEILDGPRKEFTKTPQKVPAIASGIKVFKKEQIGGSCLKRPI